MPLRLLTLILPILLISLAALAIEPAEGTIPPAAITLDKPNGTLGEVAAALSKASGIPIVVSPAAATNRCPAVFAATPFWQALEDVARATSMKVVLHDKGTKVALEPRGNSRVVVAASGPFRIAAKEVIGRELLDLGATVFEVGLEVNWEPRVRIYRIDVQPRITKTIDDRGVNLTASATSASTYPTDSLTDMKVKLTGLTRASKTIAVLAGEIKATAADRLLAIKFDALGAKLPTSKTENGVTVTLKSLTKAGNSWEVEIDLLYPETHPPFESFEEQKWLRDSRPQLIAPDGKAVDPEGDEVAARGRRVAAIYRFPGALNPLAKGWALIYETPSPLVEVKIPFELKDLPLP